MAKKSTSQVQPEDEGFLTAAARSLGHVAGEAAKALGVEAAEAEPQADAPRKRDAKPKTGKRVSARAKRIARAESAKRAASALGKEAGAGDVRYRRIMGKYPAAWTQPDIDYMERVCSAENRQPAA